MGDLKDTDTFINELINTFPEIKDEVLDEDYKGLIGLQIGCLTRFTQKAIDINDLDTVAKAFRFVEDNIDTVQYAIENSLAISYLGKLNIPKDNQAGQLLPANLKAIRNQLIKHSESPSEDDKLHSFLKRYK